MTEWCNEYTVIPCLHLDTGKEVYQIVKLDGHSFPEAGVYSDRDRAQKLADELNGEKGRENDQ
ncbi:hypothetical protein [uncultured Paraglaciecola sp.]|uniref:hypothetical protein n=1 Tax=uncultured Paraglaciecola sp. TaxID=1765024 RepID=UPI0026358E32|nr:hypothetical protein [uncultured Paraglaciecola sp.]